MPRTQNSSTHNNSARKLRIAEIRAHLPPALRMDPLGAGIWSLLESLEPQEALELPGRARDARRIGRAVAKWARERGWTVRVFSSSGNAYVRGSSSSPATNFPQLNKS
jgi:hypothetical protein